MFTGIALQTGPIISETQVKICTVLAEVQRDIYKKEKRGGKEEGSPHG